MNISIIPESAPFNTEQRAWLNGFLAGWLGLPGATAPAAVAPLPIDEPEPWHDPALVIADRLKLADAEPTPRRLMAAMAQLDCGACGYLCRTYAQAIASGVEKSLTLCSPGGSETSKALKRLLKEKSPPLNGDGASTKPSASNGAPKNGTNGWSREKPFTARILRSINLNRPGSDKETRHVELELGQDGPKYAVGDSLGVYPENCGTLVADLIATLQAQGDEQVRAPDGAETTLANALTRHACLAELTDPLIELLADKTADPVEATRLRTLLDDDAPIAGFDVLDLLRHFPSARPAPADLLAALAPVKPRLYSISSSPKRHKGQVHLTVRRVTYEHNGRERKGVASTMLADRVGPGSPIRVFIQKSHGFTLPDDPKTSVVMIGPGTGIAPFRAFLHERHALAAPGPNWLFFGDQRSATDFLYEEELAAFLDQGLLTRLDTAFSRDQGRKVYVQDRITEQGAELFRWLEAGAHIYVCGDAKRMAADVDRALHKVVREHGVMDDDASKSYLARLSSTGRYRRDVY